MKFYLQFTLVALISCSDPQAPIQEDPSIKISTTRQAPIFNFSALEQALANNDYTLAKKLFDQAKAANPKASELAAFQEKLETLRAEDRFNQFIDKANTLMAVEYLPLKKGEDDIVKTNLHSAYQALQKARALKQSHQRLNHSLNNLEKNYFNIIERSTKDHAYHRANSLIEDSLQMDIDKQRITAAKEGIGKALLRKARMMNRI